MPKTSRAFKQNLSLFGLLSIARRAGEFYPKKGRFIPSRDEVFYLTFSTPRMACQWPG